MKIIYLKTHHREELIDITAEIQNAVEEVGLNDGIITVFCPHTTAAVTINEGADKDVQVDFIKKLSEIIPKKGDYKHSEGNSDAHIKSSLVGSSVEVFVKDEKLNLGQWQAIYFCEFDGPRNREVWIK